MLIPHSTFYRSTFVDSRSHSPHPVPMTETTENQDIRLCFVGDSLVNGTGDEEALGWVGRLCARARKEGHPLTCYNLGIRRNTTRDILERMERECSLRLPPGCDGRILLSCGVNDTVQEGAISGFPSRNPSGTWRSSCCRPGPWGGFFWWVLLPWTILYKTNESPHFRKLSPHSVEGRGSPGSIFSPPWRGMPPTNRRYRKMTGLTPAAPVTKLWPGSSPPLPDGGSRRMKRRQRPEIAPHDTPNEQGDRPLYGPPAG